MQVGKIVTWFVENYEFILIGAWDKFYVYVTSKRFPGLKKYISWPIMDLVTFDKRLIIGGIKTLVDI